MSTILITGTNRGIGLELARQLHERGDRVIAVCRQPSSALSALGVRVEAGIDVTSAPCLDTLNERLGEERLDAIINNAGIMEWTGLDQLDFESMRRQFEVNALGPLRVSAALVGRLQQGGKIAVVTSRMGSIADNSSGGSYGYRMSKAAVNAGFVSLARDLEPRGVAVCILHPGWVRTDMTNGSGLVDAAESAAGLIARLDGLTAETSGGFWHMNGERLPW